MTPAARLLVALVAIAISCSAADSERAPTDAAAAPAPPRVIVLVSIDTLRPDHLGAYGYERFTSPVIDALAADGVVFEDASATTAWTLPSHASMLTGLFPMRHGVVTSKTRLPAGIPTLASLFDAGGFDTCAVVNVVWLKRDDYRLTRDFARYQWVRTSLDRRSASTFVTDAAIDCLEQVGDGRMFLFVHYYDVHSDYASEPAYEKLFVGDYDGPADGTTWQLRLANLEDDYLASCREDFDEKRCTFGQGPYAHEVDASVDEVELDARDVQHLRDLYDAQIRQLDVEIGRLVAAIQRLGLEPETLVVLTSDHGEEFREHGRLEHFLTTYQESLRVPLVLHGAGVPSGVRVVDPVSIVDLAPTLLALAGVEVEAPDAFDGLDLTPLFADEPQAAETARSLRGRYLYGEASGGHTYDLFAPGYFPIYRSVRRGSFKLVHDSKRNAYALYDLATDPLEQHDVSDREPEVREELLAEMTRRYRDGLPQTDPTDAVELSPEDRERLRALGYAP